MAQKKRRALPAVIHPEKFKEVSETITAPAREARRSIVI